MTHLDSDSEWWCITSLIDSLIDWCDIWYLYDMMIWLNYMIYSGISPGAAVVPFQPLAGVHLAVPFKGRQYGTRLPVPAVEVIVILYFNVNFIFQFLIFWNCREKLKDKKPINQSSERINQRRVAQALFPPQPLVPLDHSPRPWRMLGASWSPMPMDDVSHMWPECDMMPCHVMCHALPVLFQFEAKSRDQWHGSWFRFLRCVNCLALIPNSACLIQSQIQKSPGPALGQRCRRK